MDMFTIFVVLAAAQMVANMPLTIAVVAFLFSKSKD